MFYLLCTCQFLFGLSPEVIAPKIEYFIPSYYVGLDLLIISQFQRACMSSIRKLLTYFIPT